ncbi:tetratricopeptide repeat protein [Bacteroidota bacterium]
MLLSRILFILLFVIPVFSIEAQVDDPDIVVPAVKPGNPTEDEKLAAQYFQNKEFDKAAEIYERLYEKKRSQFYYTYYFQCLVELKDLKTAEKFLKREMRKAPNNFRYLVDLGYIYHISNEPEKAKEKFKEALGRLSANQSKISELANAFIIRRLDDYAIETYLLGKKLLKGSYTFGYEIAQIYERTGNYEMMVIEYLDLIDFDQIHLNGVQSRLQYALSDDPDNYKGDIIKTVLLKRVQKNPDKEDYAKMLLWLSIQLKDFELAFIQAKSLDRRFNEEGESVFRVANLSSSNKNYDVAIKAYKYLVNQGPESSYYLGSKVRMLDVKYKKITENNEFTINELLELEKEYTETILELGKNASTVSLLKNLAHIRAFYLDKTNEAIELLGDAINLSHSVPTTQAECKIELADVYLFISEVWEATLLYSQVEKAFKNDPMGHFAKFKNAKLSFYIGEFEWAKAQLDVLKAATSKLIANDAMELSLVISDNIDLDSSTVALSKYARADLLLYQNKYDLALQTLDSVNMVSLSHPLFDEVLYKKAQIKIKLGLYLEADSLLQKTIEFYPYDILADNALFLKAELNEFYLNNKTKAMELYQKLLNEYPGSLFSVEARKRYRALRGDLVN